MTLISVIICTHNPREDLLQRTLNGLRAQTYSRELWELILIDNRSEQPLRDRVDLSWHPHARVIREDELGLTASRLRGITEALGKVLIFVDDDNVLQSDYLTEVARIEAAYPNVGAWGGQNTGEFEGEFPASAQPYRPFLALRDVPINKWSNYHWDTEPCGAGMCVRKDVATKYASLVKNDPRRRKLDRTGKNLVSSGDLDIAKTCYDIGLGTGLFSSLQLIHIIPKARLKLSYLRRLAENISHSQTMLSYLRSGDTGEDFRPLRRRLIDRTLSFLQRNLAGAHQRRFEHDLYQGRQRALKDIQDLRSGKRDAHGPLTHGK